MCAHFGVESGMIFEGTTRVYERICGFNSKWVRTNSKWILRNRFCCCFDRSNGDIKRPGLKTGMHFRGQI